MTSKDIAKGIVKGLPALGALALGVGATLAVFTRDALDYKMYDKLYASHITKEAIPLQ